MAEAQNTPMSAEDKAKLHGAIVGKLEKRLEEGSLKEEFRNKLLVDGATPEARKEQYNKIATDIVENDTIKVKDDKGETKSVKVTDIELDVPYTAGLLTWKPVPEDYREMFLKDIKSREARAASGELTSDAKAAEEETRKALLEGLPNPSEEDKKEVDKRAKAIGRAVDENTSDTTKGWGGGASWGNILFGLIEWICGGFKNGMDGLKQCIGNEVANGIETSAKKNLTDAGVDEKEAKDLAAMVRTKTLAKAEVEDLRPPTAKEPETTPATTPPEQSSSQQKPAENAVATVAVGAGAAQAVVNSPAPVAQAPAQVETPKPVTNPEPAKTAPAPTQPKPQEVATQPPVAPPIKQEPKPQPAKPAETKLAKSPLDIVRNMISSLMGKNDETIAKATLLAVANNQNALETGNYATVADNTASSLLTNPTTLDIIIPSVQQRLTETGASITDRAKFGIAASKARNGDIEYMKDTADVGFKDKVTGLINADADGNGIKDGKDLASAMADFRNSCKGSGATECNPEQLSNFIAKPVQVSQAGTPVRQHT